MKKKTVIVTLFILLAIVIISAFIYFVAGVSSTYPPIKKYKYSGSINQFVTTIKNYASTYHDINVKITDTVGSLKDDYALYLSIEMKSHKDSIVYALRCEKGSSDNGRNKTIILMVEAYDKTRNTGGYSKEAKGIRALTIYFDTVFLVELKNKQNIQIDPL